MRFVMKSSLSILLPLLANVMADNHWRSRDLDVELPKAISDHSVALDPESGLIYIAGGCDHPFGNKFYPDNDGGSVYCASYSTSFYAFDPVAETFAYLPDLPRERYRHSSNVVDGKVWILGGRTAMDDTFPVVDVYDIATEKWTTLTAPASMQVSDHGSFADSDSIFVVGGYDANYTALNLVQRIDTAAALETTEVKFDIEQAAPLETARGDIIAATSSDGKYAFVGGGFTPENDWCEPLGSVERYSFEDGTWTTLPSLNHERAEVVFVELERKLYALGGERQIENICDLLDAFVSDTSLSTDEVEVYDPVGDEWEVLEKTKDQIFRFQAVSVESRNLIYTFGGQIGWNDDCECFQTTDRILVYGYDFSALSGGKTRYSAVNSMIVTIGILFVSTIASIV